MPPGPIGSSMTRMQRRSSRRSTMSALKIGRNARATTAAALFATTLALAVTAHTDAARATAPGANGLIVYQATVGKHIQLFTVKPDGSDVRRLTRFTDSDAAHASWSPDGTKLIFERDFAKHAGIFTMN